MGLTDHTGVVLAGGTSRRFAVGDKTLATIEGVPLVVRVVDRLAAATGPPVVVSVRTDDQRNDVESALSGVGTRTTFARDHGEFEGPLAGVVAAVDSVETGRTVLVACDMPLLDPGLIEWLAGIGGESEADAVVPVARRPQPLQAVYRTAAIRTAVTDLPRSGGLSALLDGLSVKYVDIAAAPEAVAAERSLTNVNTVADLEWARGGGSS